MLQGKNCLEYASGSYLDSVKILGKYAVLEQHNRKKKGKPTEKGIVAMRAEDEGARQYVDKAPPKVLAIPSNSRLLS